MMQEEGRINAKRPKRSTRGIKPSRYRDENDELDEGLAPIEKKKKKRRGGTTSTTNDVNKWKSTLQKESNGLLRELSSNSMHQIDSLDVPTSPTGSQSSKCNEPMHFDDSETAPPASPIPPAADDNPPASPLNSADPDIVSRAEHNQLAEAVEQLVVEVNALKARSFSTIPTLHTPGQVELKSSNGKIFQVKKDCFTKACAALTLQAVVKSVASGLTSGPEDTVYFRGASKEGAIIQREFITDLIVVTRLALRKLDKYSRQPVLRIMREGESVGLVKRNKNEADAPNSTKMTVDERKIWFSGQLTYDRVKSWTSAGFRESRRNKTQK